VATPHFTLYLTVHFTYALPTLSPFTEHTCSLVHPLPFLPQFAIIPRMVLPLLPLLPHLHALPYRHGCAGPRTPTAPHIRARWHYCRAAPCAAHAALPAAPPTAHRFARYLVYLLRVRYVAHTFTRYDCDEIISIIMSL